MKEEQLMINDIVTLVVTTYNELTDKEETSSHPAKITDISPSVMLYGDCYNCSIYANFLYGFDAEFYGCEIEPIPLTAEILKANGFELDTPCIMLYQPKEIDGHYNSNGELQYIEASFRRNELYKIEIHNIVREKQYGTTIVSSEISVHQLQHALRLCKISNLADNLKLE